MLPGCRVLSVSPGRSRSSKLLAAGVVLVLLVAVCVVPAFCSSMARKAPVASVSLAPRTHLPAATTSVLTGTPDMIAEGAAQDLFTSAPVVVIAGPDKQADTGAARQALQIHAPLLLTSAGAAKPVPGDAETTAKRTAMRTVSGSAQATAAVVSAAFRARLKALNPHVVLTVGIPAKVLAAQLPGIRVISNPAMLPATKAPTPLDHVALLVPAGDSDAGTLASITTARVAGGTGHHRPRR